MKLKCNHCGYIWNYKGKLILASCPSCRHAVDFRKNQIIEVPVPNE